MAGYLKRIGGFALFRVLPALVLTGLLLNTCQTFDSQAHRYADLADRYQVRILRDVWGVPHIYGETDPDVAFGLAYAHAEDDFGTICEALLAARGNLAAHQGKDAAPIDYIVHLLRLWDDIEAKYASDLSPEVRAICEAYADGINYYLAKHPAEAPRGILPVRGQDVVAGFVLKTPFFFGLDNAIQSLFRDTRPKEVSPRREQTAASFFTRGLPMGSNTFAVAPHRASDGKTRLAVNSHQPWTGPVAWYEAHLHSNEGWDIVGGLFPGTPVILHGHNRHLGWAHTVNSPDLVDVYVLDMNPENENQYRFDGVWRDLEVRTAHIKVKIWGPISWTVKREVLWSVHGPVVRQPHGVYAIRYAGMGDIRQVEQWYRLNKAQDFEAWRDAMAMQAVPSFNAGYADEKGNIYYHYNARLPRRSAAYNWEMFLPGDTSETLWTEYLGYDAVPHVLNPASGFIQNCNSSPFQTTTGPENPDPANFPASAGIETHMTNRALRAMALLGGDDSITAEEFDTYKYDMVYAPDSTIGQSLRNILEAPASSDPLVQEAIAVLRDYDLTAYPESVGTALLIPAVRKCAHGFTDIPDADCLLGALGEVAAQLKKEHGSLTVPWGEVNRLRHGKTDLPLGGGPDTLHAAYGGFADGIVTVEAGDCYILMVEWGEDGVSSRSIHQFGSATLDTRSKHYDDQAAHFADCKLKPVWMDEADIRAQLEEEYRPGEEKIRR